MYYIIAGQFAMSHGSYDSNLGSEILILGRDINITETNDKSIEGPWFNDLFLTRIEVGILYMILILDS